MENQEELETQKQEHLSEARYKKARKKFLILGIIGIPVLIGGLVMAIIGFTGDPFDSANAAFMPGGMFITFVGLVITAVGFNNAYARNIAAYSAQTMLPVKTETFNKGSHMSKDGIKTVAEAIKDGLSNDGLESQEKALMKLEQMKEKKLITEEEYKKMRSKILGL